MSRIVGHAGLARALGDAGYERARGITWDGVIDRLIEARQPVTDTVVGRHPRVQRSASIAPLVAALRWRRRGARSSWSTMDRSDDTGARAAGAGAHASSGIRTTRATAPRSKPASGTRPGTFVLIIDADGQHRPADAPRLVAQLGEYDLVVGARSSATQAGAARRVGNPVAEPAGELSHRPAPFPI